MELDGLVRELAESRRAAIDWSLRIGELEKALVETDLGKELEAAKQHLAAAKSGEREVDGTLRAAALRHFEQHADKQPHPAVKITQRITLEYDEGVAIGYCMKMLPEALGLVKGKFNPVAKVTKPEFVAFRRIPSVSISKDIWHYLEEADGHD